MDIQYKNNNLIITDINIKECFLRDNTLNIISYNCHKTFDINFFKNFKVIKPDGTIILKNENENEYFYNKNRMNLKVTTIEKK